MWVHRSVASELEDLPPAIPLLPRIQQFKDAVIDPDSCSDFLIDNHTFCGTEACFESLGNLMKHPILSEATTGIGAWLIDGFWMWPISQTWNVVTFVNENAPIVLDTIRIARGNPDSVARALRLSSASFSRTV